MGEVGEGARSPAGGRIGGVYPALVALVTVASKAEETNLEKNHSKAMKGRNYSKSWCSAACWQPPHGFSLTFSRLPVGSDGGYLDNRYLL